MTITLSPTMMAEAEVSLRLAFYLLSRPESGATAVVAIDGAHVRVHGEEVFPLARFLELAGWRQTEQQGKNPWQGNYTRDGKTLLITPKSGIGDVVAAIAGKNVRAECKKGPLIPKKGNPEFPLIREAIGQLMTVEKVTENDFLVVGIPCTEGFRKLARRWQGRPLMVQTKITIALIGRDGVVEGLPW